MRCVRPPSCTAAGFSTASAVHGLLPGTRIGFSAERVSRRILASFLRRGFEKRAPSNTPAMNKEKSSARVFAKKMKSIQRVSPQYHSQSAHWRDNAQSGSVLPCTYEIVRALPAHHRLLD